MDDILKYTGLTTIIIIGFIIAYKVMTTIIWLFFSGMLLMLTYPIWSLVILGSLTAISFAYFLITEK
jgi:hypothetical protein